MLNWAKSLSVTLLVSGAIGCGGGSGGGVTRVPPNTKLMTLSASQKTQLCNDIIAYDARTISNAELCKLQGVYGASVGLNAEPTITDAQLQTLCSQTETDCNAGPFDPGSCPVGDTSTCSADATISDASMCVADDEAAFKASVAALPACSGVTKAWLQANANLITNGPPPSASCTALSVMCPDIL